MISRFAPFHGQLRSLSFDGNYLYLSTEVAELNQSYFFRFDLEKDNIEKLHTLNVNALETRYVAKLGFWSSCWLFADTEQKKRHYQLLNNDFEPELTAEQPIAAFIVMPDEKANKVKHLLFTQGSQLHCYDLHTKQTNVIHCDEEITALALDSHQQWLAVGMKGGTVSVYQWLESAWQHSDNIALHHAPVTHLGFDLDEVKFYSIGGDKRLFEIYARGKLVATERTQASHKKDISAVYFPHAKDDCKARFYTASNDGQCYGWSRTTKHKPSSFNSSHKPKALTQIKSQGKAYLVAITTKNDVIKMPLDDEQKIACISHQYADGYVFAEQMLEKNDPALQKDWLLKLKHWGDQKSLEIVSQFTKKNRDVELLTLATKVISCNKLPSMPTHLYALFEHDFSEVRNYALTLSAQVIERPFAAYKKALSSGHADTVIQALDFISILVQQEQITSSTWREILEEQIKAPLSQVRLFSLGLYYAKEKNQAVRAARASEHADVRQQILLHLWQENALTEQVLGFALEDSSYEVSYLAYQLLLAEQPSLLSFLLSQNEVLLAHFEEREPWYPPNFSLKKSHKKPTAEVVDILIRASFAKNKQIAVFAACDWAKLANEQVVPLLLQLFISADAQQLPMLIQALALFAKSAQQDLIHQSLQQALTHNESAIRISAWQVLAKEGILAVNFALQTQQEDVLQLAFEHWRQHANFTQIVSQKGQSWVLLEGFFNHPLLGIAEQAGKWFLGHDFGNKLGFEQKMTCLANCEQAKLRQQAYCEAQIKLTQPWARKLLVQGCKDVAVNLALDSFAALSTFRKGADIETLLQVKFSQHEIIRQRLLEHCAQYLTDPLVQEFFFDTVLKDPSQALQLQALDILVPIMQLATAQQQTQFEPLLEASHPQIKIQTASCLSTPLAADVLLNFALAQKPVQKEQIATWKELRLLSLKGLALQSLNTKQLHGLFVLWQKLNGKEVDSEREALATNLQRIFLNNTPVKADQEDQQQLTGVLQATSWTTWLQEKMDLILAFRGVKEKIDFCLQSNTFSNDYLILSLVYNHQQGIILNLERTGLTDIERYLLLICFYAHCGQQIKQGRNTTIITLIQQLSLQIESKNSLYYLNFLQNNLTDLPMVQHLVSVVTAAFNQRIFARQDTWTKLWAALLSGNIVATQYAVQLIYTMLQEADQKKQSLFDLTVAKYEPYFNTLDDIDENLFKQVLLSQKTLLTQWRLQGYLQLIQAGKNTDKACERLIKMWQQSVEEKDPQLWQTFKPALSQVQLSLSSAISIQAIFPIYQNLASTEDHAWLLDLMSLANTAWHQLAFARLVELNADAELRTVALTFNLDIAQQAFNYILASLSESQIQAWLEQGLVAKQVSVQLTSIEQLEKIDPQLLLPALKSDSANVRAHAASYLVNLGRMEAFEPLVDALKQKQDAWEMRDYIVKLKRLSSFGELPRSLVATLIEQCERVNGLNHLYGLIADLRDTRPESIDCLLTHVTSNNTQISDVAVRLLLDFSGFTQQFTSDGQLPSKPLKYPLREDILCRLLEKLLHPINDDYLYVLDSAKKAFESAVEPLLIKFALSGNEKAAVQAILAIQWRKAHRENPAKEDLKPLLPLLQQKSEVIRFYVAELLVCFDYSQAISVLLSTAELHQDLALRRRAILALGYSKEQQCFDKLLALLNDSEHALHAAACEAIGQLEASLQAKDQKQAEHINRQLCKAIESPDWLVRYHALMGLRWLNTEQSWQFVLQSLTDLDQDVQERAATILRFAPVEWVGAQLLQILAKPISENACLSESLSDNAYQLAYASAQLLYSKDASLVDFAYLRSGRACETAEQQLMLQRAVQQVELSELLLLVDSLHEKVFETFQYHILNRTFTTEHKILLAQLNFPSCSTRQWQLGLDLLQAAKAQMQADTTKLVQAQLLTLWRELYAKGFVDEQLLANANAAKKQRFGFDQNDWLERLMFLAQAVACFELDLSLLQSARAQLAQFSDIVALFDSLTPNAAEDIFPESELWAFLCDSQTQVKAIEQILQTNNYQLLSKQALDIEQAESLRLLAIVGLTEAHSEQTENLLIDIAKKAQPEEIIKAAWRGLSKSRRFRNKKVRTEQLLAKEIR